MSEIGAEIQPNRSESQLTEYKKKVVARFLPELQKVYEKEAGDISISFLNGVDSKGNKSEAISIGINPQTGKDVGLLMDFDDTVVNTTRQKKIFFDKVSEQVPLEKRGAFGLVSQWINAVARSLPEDESGNHIHTPLLEMRALTKAVQVANAPDTFNQKLPEVVDTSTIDDNQLLEEITLQNKQNVQKFIMEEVSPESFPDGWPTVDVTQVQNNLGMTFKKEAEASTDVDFNNDSSPLGVNAKVWEAYREIMAKPTIPDEELQNFDAIPNAHYVFATSGFADYQLAKVVNVLKQLQGKGRLPDELLIFTKGRKNEILNNYANASDIQRFVFIDENPNQIVTFAQKKSEKIALKLARREGIKRHDDSAVPKNIPRVKMEETKLSQILSFPTAA